MRADSGGVVNAPRKPIAGRASASREARLACTGGKGAAAADRRRQRHAGPVRPRGRRRATVVAFTVDDGRITAIDIVRNPDKLRDLPS